MPLIPQAQDSALAGDLARRRAGRCLVLSLLATPASIWLFLNLDTIWPKIMVLEGATFMIGATVLGTVLALTPLAAGIGFLLSVWYGVESVYLPRRGRSPLLDKGIVAGGLLVWFAPALAAAASIVMGLIQGRLHFTRPPRDYFMATDPIAFWQGIGFWLIMGTLFGMLAWRYWRNKLLKKQAA
ncbi:hypothetical protein J5J83_02725 [Azoarcus sp. L1K30]|uniref:hypothetical protein n=1 Tax=Azoarcus sp. L1K30 TaxID=2820277 RepID=UPI001B810331|nr:hypothetical protein [Azoarcus sp. L1K30]MBR0565030.1 hypothetical protein [Azoarcus sp. L1K30]